MDSYYEIPASLRALLVFCFLAVFLGLAAAGTAMWALIDSSSGINTIRDLATNYGDLTGIYFSLGCPIAFGFATILPLIFSFLIICTKYDNEDEEDKQRYYYIKILLIIIIIYIIIELPFIIVPMAMNVSVTPANLLTALINSLKQESRGLPYSWLENYNVSFQWDKLMISRKCCGVSGTSDYTTNFLERTLTWYQSYRRYTLTNGTYFSGNSVKLPQSCCTLNTADNLISKGDYWNIQKYLNSELCPLTLDATLGSSGCYILLQNDLDSFTTAIFILQMIMLLWWICALITIIYTLCKKYYFNNENENENDDDDYNNSNRISNGRRTTRPFRTTFGNNNINKVRAVQIDENGKIVKELPQTTYSNRLNDIYYSK